MGLAKSPLATCGILSLGDMGTGIARLLIAHDFKVITNASDRRLTYYPLIIYFADILLTVGIVKLHNPALEKTTSIWYPTTRT